MFGFYNEISWVADLVCNSDPQAISSCCLLSSILLKRLCKTNFDRLVITDDKVKYRVKKLVCSVGVEVGIWNEETKQQKGKI